MLLSKDSNISCIKDSCLKSPRNLFTPLELEGQPAKLPTTRKTNYRKFHKSLSSEQQLPSLLKTEQTLEEAPQQYDRPILRATTKQKLITEYKTSESLGQVRKQFDQEARQSQKVIRKIMSMKEQIQMMRAKAEIKKEYSDFAGKRYSELNARFEEVSQMQTNATTFRKTLEHVLERMKHDKIVYQIQRQQLEEKVKVTSTELLIQEQNRMSLQQTSVKTQNCYHRIYAKEQKLVRKRVQRLETFEAELSKLETKDSFTKRVHSEASEEPLFTRRELTHRITNTKKEAALKVYMVHSFLHKMLKDRASSLLKNYSQVESSFKRIKACIAEHSDPNENVVAIDGQLLVQKYFEHGIEYERIVNKIQTMEKRRKELERKNEMLRVKKEQLEANVLFGESESGADGRQKDGRNVRQSRDRTGYLEFDYNYTDERKLQNINIWIFENLAKLSCRKHANTMYAPSIDDTSTESMTRSFKTLCKSVLSLNKQMEPFHTKYIETKFKTPGIEIRKRPKKLTQQEERQKIMELETAAMELGIDAQWVEDSRSSMKKIQLMQKKLSQRASLHPLMMQQGGTEGQTGNGYLFKKIDAQKF